MNKYYSLIQNDVCFIRLFQQYDRRYVELTHQLIPWKEFNEDFNEQHFDDDKNSNRIDRRDYCLIRLLSYFKENLFTWVNKLKCDNCDQDCELIECRRCIGDANVYYCQRIEIYKCPTCNSIAEFPRYNHAGRLLETRKGRCGEWALCFAYICFVYEYDIRMVHHVDDHVWVEIYSDHQRRWIHCDPCENSYDQPLLYECGWKKPATLIVATGMNEIRDVTWRYASEWRKTVAIRRQLFNENELQSMILEKNLQLHSKLTDDEREKILYRWLGEMAELLRTPDQDIRLPNDDNCCKGRISGSIEWRESRGESKNSYYEFILDRCGCKILYNCQQDEYRIMDSKKTTTTKTIKGWKSGCYESENIFRMIEMDWQMCYLCRSKYCRQKDSGRIKWRFQLPNDGEWNRINILVMGKTYESGVVELNVLLQSNQDSKLSFKLNEWFQLNKSHFNDNKWFDIEAILMFGESDIAWQHAQLFRQNLKSSKDEDSNFTFVVQIE